MISRKTTGDNQAPLYDPFVQPVFAVLDSVYTYTLPPRQVQTAVVDVFVHRWSSMLLIRSTGKFRIALPKAFCSHWLKRSESLAGTGKLQRACERHVGGNQALNGLIGSGVPQDWATHTPGHD
ncbi:hypothetical protein ACNKHK_19460 [Shigella flexneri]